MAKKKTTKNKKVKKETAKDPILEYVNKAYGKGKIFKLPDKEDGYNPSDFIDTGSLCLNYLITGDYRCGIPRRKPIEIFGPESVGKTTLALHVAIEASKQKYRILDCDAERGLNEYYAKQLGIDNKLFYYFHSDNGEESFTITEDLIEKFHWDLYIYDSVGGMRSRAIMENGYDDQNMGSNARLMTKAVTRLSKYFFKYNIAPIFINQIGSKIGGYGNPEETKGGKTFKYFLWCRLEVRAPRGDKIEIKTKILNKGSLNDVINEEEISEHRKYKKKKEKEEKPKKKTIETGTIITVKSVKNKLFMPRRTCKIKIDYGKGIDKKFDLIEYLDMQGIVQRVGKSKIFYNDKNIMIESFFKKYNRDENFRKKISDLIEEDRKKQKVVTEDEKFTD